jgi:hypothetical protein
MISGIGDRVLIFRANAIGLQLPSKKDILVLPRLRHERTLRLAGGVGGDAKVTEVGSGPISVIARQMNMIRDAFIPEVFDTMQAEIRGLNHDGRMLDFWKASLTESFDAGIDYLNRGMPLGHGPQDRHAGLGITLNSPTGFSPGTRPLWDSCHRSFRTSTTTLGPPCPGRRDCKL